MVQKCDHGQTFRGFQLLVDATLGADSRVNEQLKAAEGLTVVALLHFDMVQKCDHGQTFRGFQLLVDATVGAESEDQFLEFGVDGQKAGGEEFFSPVEINSGEYLLVD